MRLVLCKAVKAEGKLLSAHTSLHGLASWIEQNGLEGYDPYDALANPLLAWLGNRSNTAGRLAIQTLRFFPFNVRPLLGIPSAPNTKGLGLLARGYFLIWDRTRTRNDWDKAIECLHLLEELCVPGFSGACWAHSFPYRSRHSYTPAGYPTVVSTVYAAQAFLDAYERTQDPRWRDIARSACDFILEDLPRIGTTDQFCFSYYPGTRLPIHNANLLAASLLARMARIGGDDSWLELVYASLQYTLEDQQLDGSWPYDGPDSTSRTNTFVDGFHTGFVLESLWDISQDTGFNLDEPIARGLDFYLEHLFESNGQPYRFTNQLWPLDLRDCAQGIITLARLHGLDQRADTSLHQVAKWTVSNMQDPKDYFYYLRWKWFVTPISYIRFQGWMLVALARYLHVST